MKGVGMREGGGYAQAKRFEQELMYSYTAWMAPGGLSKPSKATATMQCPLQSNI